MKLPIIENNEVVPVRLIPFLTHGNYGRESITCILSHEWKVCGSRQDEHRAAIAQMKACRRASKDTRDTGFNPMKDILPKDCEEDSGDIMNREEPYAYRLNDDGVPVQIPVEEWRTVCYQIKPVIELARREEDTIGIEGAKLDEWHVTTLEIIPDDAFMWKADLEKIYPPDKLNYNVRIRNLYKPLVQEAFGRLRVITKKPTPDKKPLSKGMKRPGDLGILKTIVAGGLQLFTKGSGRDFINSLRTCFETKSDYPFMDKVVAIEKFKSNGKEHKEFICVQDDIPSEKWPDGKHWHSQHTFLTAWSTLRKEKTTFEK